MTWSEFLTTMFVIYLFYYAVNIVMDLIGGGTNKDKEEFETLSFVDADDTQPKRVSFEDYNQEEKQIKEKVAIPIPEEKIVEFEPIKRKEEEKKEDGLKGGVTFSQLLKLAKDEAIVKSNTIAFS